MALESDGGAGPKRRREDEEGGQRETAEEAAKVKLLSALPDDLLLRILTFLPLKFAIRTSVISREWRERDLWKRRWPDPSSLDKHLKQHPQELLDELEQRRREGHRLDRFSIILETSTMNSLRFRRCLECVAACSVEDLHIELRSPTPTELNFHFPKSSPLLARLSLHRIRVSNFRYRDARPFAALEIIQLHSVPIQNAVLSRMVALCPSLRVLDLRYCNRLSVLDLRSCNGLRVLDLRYCNDLRKIAAGTPNLRSLTVAECSRVTRVDVVTVFRLRSCRYSGAFPSTLHLPVEASFADLYICYRVPKYRRMFNTWFKDTLSNLSNLNVLTICSNALQTAYPLSVAGALAELAEIRSFQSLRELQLLMFEMKAINLANIYVFLKKCYCPVLERLFLQLPTISAVSSVDLFDELVVEPPEDKLENLVVAKIVNFNWNCAEVQLVSFLLRNACSLHTLLLVSPNVDPLNVPVIRQADRLLLVEVVANGKVILSDSDDAATRPFHSEVFAEF